MWRGAKIRIKSKTDACGAGSGSVGYVEEADVS